MNKYALLCYMVLLIPANSRSITCDKTAAQMCGDLLSCLVKCDEGCETLLPGDRVSVCGWLHSLGYNTSLLSVTVGNFNIKVVAVSSVTYLSSGKVDITEEDRSLTPKYIKDKIKPYQKFLFVEEPTSRKEEKNKNVTFRCAAKANSVVSYQWFHAPYKQLPTMIYGAESTDLLLFNVSRADTGFYLCRAKETATGDVYWSKPASLEVLYIEEPVHQTYDKQVLSGTLREIVSCVMPASHPPAVASWYKYTGESVQKIVDKEDMFYYSNTGELYLINTASSSHGGVYECLATNEVLNVSKSVLKINITIIGNQATAKRGPVKAFFDSQAADKVVVGQSLTMRCAAYGNPPPKIYWSFGDDKHTLCKIPSSRYRAQDQGRYVVLDRVKAQDLDYTYECKGENTVDTKPDVRSIGQLKHVGSYRKLDIKGDKVRHTPHWGTYLNLSCSIQGKSFQLMWYKNGENLDPQGDYWKVNHVNGHSLEVHTNTTECHGTYTCLAVDLAEGGLVLHNFHVTVPVLGITVHLARDKSNEVDTYNYLTCLVSGFPPPRVYWLENGVTITDSTRYTIQFDKTNSTIINTTLNISNLLFTTEFKCVAISQSEDFISFGTATYAAQGQIIETRVGQRTVYIIVGAAVFVVLLLCFLLLLVMLRFREERRTSKPIRSYMKNVNRIEKEDGLEISSKAKLLDEYKYAAQLRDILKTFEIEDDGDLESFRDVIGEWMDEEFQTGDSDFARRFRESFLSKKSSRGNKGRLNSSSRLGNNFRLNLKGKATESRLLDNDTILQRQSPFNANNLYKLQKSDDRKHVGIPLEALPSSSL